MFAGQLGNPSAFLGELSSFFGPMALQYDQLRVARHCCRNTRGIDLKSDDDAQRGSCVGFLFRSWEKTMNAKWMILGLLVLALGCQPAEDTAPAPEAPAPEAPVDGSAAATTPVSIVKYCGQCGQAKGSEACCATTAETCASCDFHKGAALCCKVTKDAEGRDFCGKCGQVAGTEVCCAKDAETCDCGMAKGSPLCCKLSG